MVFYEPTCISGTVHIKRGYDEIFKNNHFPTSGKWSLSFRIMSHYAAIYCPPFQFSFRFTSYDFCNTLVSHLGIKIPIS